MEIKNSSVTVKQMSEILSAKQGQIFLHEMQCAMNSDRPRIVLDFSNVPKLDKSIIYLLLCCLEEAMKRNGNIKLAALPAGAGEILDITGVNRIFDIYDTAYDAVNSFHPIPAGAIFQTPAPMRPHAGTESAA